MPMTSGQINRLGDFKNREQEERYRDHNLESARKLTGIISGIVLFASFAFIITDVGEQGTNLSAVISRLVMAAVAVFSLYLVYAIRTQPTVYFATYLVVLTVALGNVYIATTRPPDFLISLGVDVIILIGVYIVIPTISVQLLLAITYTVVLIVLHFAIKEPRYEIAHVTVPLTLTLANLLGLGMSVLYNRTRHQMFAQLEELQLAERNVRALSELIPMCASCKKIRNDAGYWEQVETYMTAISGVDVSHGICPECIAEFYDSDEQKQPPAHL